MSAAPITIALLGGGTVGAEVARLLVSDAADFERRIGAPLQLTAVAVRDAGRARPGIDPALITDDAVAVAASGADIVVELMGGIEPARTLKDDNTRLAELTGRFKVGGARPLNKAPHGP
jgi:homoserine dehydrogenase